MNSGNGFIPIKQNSCNIEWITNEIIELMKKETTWNAIDYRELNKKNYKQMQAKQEWLNEKVSENRKQIIQSVSKIWRHR